MPEFWDELQYFTKSEFECKCGCGRADMDEEFMRKLESVRHKVGVPFPVTSGFRCPEHNNKVSKSGLNGPHTTGKAADLGISYRTAREALRHFCEEFGGIGVNQKGDSRFLHVDDLPMRLWSY